MVVVLDPNSPPPDEDCWFWPPNKDMVTGCNDYLGRKKKECEGKKGRGDLGQHRGMMSLKLTRAGEL